MVTKSRSRKPNHPQEWLPEIQMRGNWNPKTRNSKRRKPNCPQKWLLEIEMPPKQNPEIVKKNPEIWYNIDCLSLINVMHAEQIVLVNIFKKIRFIIFGPLPVNSWACLMEPSSRCETYILSYGKIPIEKLNGSSWPYIVGKLAVLDPAPHDSSLMKRKSNNNRPSKYEAADFYGICLCNAVLVFGISSIGFFRFRAIISAGLRPAFE